MKKRDIIDKDEIDILNCTMNNERPDHIRFHFDLKYKPQDEFSKKFGNDWFADVVLHSYEEMFMFDTPFNNKGTENLYYKDTDGNKHYIDVFLDGVLQSLVDVAKETLSKANEKDNIDLDR